MTGTLQQISGLLHEAGETHHQVFRHQMLRPPHGIDVHHISAARPLSGQGRLAVDQQAADFGQRHP